MMQFLFHSGKNVKAKLFPAPLHFSPGKRKTNGISGRARPGGKGVARKNHEARFTSWTGRATAIADWGLRNAD